MLHNIKIEEPFGEAVLEGTKTFEIRYNDRGYNAGDFVHFIMLDNLHCENSLHRISKKLYKITYVYSGRGLQEGWIVFGFEEIKEEPN